MEAKRAETSVHLRQEIPMRMLVLALSFAFAGPALAQDAVAVVLQAAPQLVSLAGSPENFASLVLGLSEGTPIRLAGPGRAGFRSVTTVALPAALAPAQVVDLLSRIQNDFRILGISEPTPEQLATALGGGVLDTPAGSTAMRGAYAAARSTTFEADARRPSPDEQALAALPAEIRALVQDLPPRAALQKVELADQNLIALGIPYPSTEQRRAALARVLDGGYASVEASAGGTTYPALSPLVSPYLRP
jgi:hypothetical protein